MRNSRLNHLIVLRLYQEETSKMYIWKLLHEFPAKKAARKERFTLLQVL